MVGGSFRFVMISVSVQELNVARNWPTDRLALSGRDETRTKEKEGKEENEFLLFRFLLKNNVLCSY